MSSRSVGPKKTSSFRNLIPRLRSKKSFEDSLKTPPPDGGSANGFQSIPEKEVLQVEAGSIAPFTLPQEILSFEPADENIVFRFKNGDSERKLHCNLQLASEEEERLRALRNAAMNQGKAFVPSISASASRYLSHSRGNPELALQMMQNTQNWRSEFFENPLSDEMVRDDFQHGIIYFIGRDKCLRPTLVVRPKRIPQAWRKAKSWERLTRLTIFCVEYALRYMFIPGRAESFNIILDLKDVSVSEIPVSALKDMHAKFGSHYVGRGSKTYICNMSWLLSPLVKIAKGIISERQAQKLQFVKNVKEFANDFALHQLEEDLGGSMPLATQFFPFPLQAGPFDAGYSKGPGSDRVPKVHEALTREGARGRLWNASLGTEENKQLEYTEAAAEIFKACGLPVPPNCPIPAPQIAEVAADSKVGDIDGQCEEPTTASVDNGSRADATAEEDQKTMPETAATTADDDLRTHPNKARDDTLTSGELADVPQSAAADAAGATRAAEEDTLAPKQDRKMVAEGARIKPQRASCFCCKETRGAVDQQSEIVLRESST